MHKFTLEKAFHINGIGSASGIYSKDNSVFLISDNGGYLYEFKTDSQLVTKTVIVDNEAPENIPKKLKPDFEALAAYGNKLFIFGSGSTENRNKMACVDLTTNTITLTDISPLYISMQNFAGISALDFNIEGVACDGAKWYFFQRGNGRNSQNGIFTITGENLEQSPTIAYTELHLPEIKGVRAGFTDAILVDDILYFLATSEDSKSTYEDGEINGSLIGAIAVRSMEIINTQIITNTHKFEGIALLEQNADSISFLLCEDNDTETLESDIFKLVLPKF